MVDEMIVWWTLSSLLQGLCAIYGLLLVYYVYQRSKAYEHIQKLRESSWPLRWEPKESEVRWVLSEDVTRIGAKFNEVAEVDRREIFVLQQLLWFSIWFVVAVSLDVSGLVWKDVEWLFWAGVVASSLLIVFIGLSLALTAVYVLHSGRTAGYDLVRDGWKFYEDHEYYEMCRVRMEDVDEELVGQWRKRARKRRKEWKR